MELVKIERNQIAGQTVQTANARDLHAFLEVKKDFSDWVKAQIKRAMLVENVDFVVLPQKGENPSGGRPALEYHLTIEAGKHIAMLAGTAKGKEVRVFNQEQHPGFNSAEFLAQYKDSTGRELMVMSEAGRV